MQLINFIIWSANPEIFPGIDAVEIRWYGLLFALAFIVGQQIMFYIYKKENKPEKDVDVLTLTVLIVTIIGARLGHVLFYDVKEYFSDPVSILKIWEGGLASHGAAIGIIAGIYLFSNYVVNLNPLNFTWKKKKRTGQDFFWVIDRVVITVALGGCFIRMGNFMNSGIIGKPTESNYGVIFAQDLTGWLESHEEYIEDVAVEKTKIRKADENGHVPVAIKIEFVRGTERPIIENIINNGIKNELSDANSDISLHFFQPKAEKLNYEMSVVGAPAATIYAKAIPRHPTQLYEAATSLLIFIFLFLIWRKRKEKTPRGLLFSLFLIVLFSLRLVHELFKENQEQFEDALVLNMGQILSIPLVLAGIIILLNLKRLQR